MKIQPVILAGGNGSRLWPLSQKTKPKQFLKYHNDLSSFQNTLIRNSYLGVPLIIGNIAHYEILIKQLKEINLPAKIIFEYEQKNTAICALSASYYAKNQGFNEIILIPSDHHIEDHINYQDSLEKASRAVKQYKFGTIGVTPLSPNINFGYIKIEQKIEEEVYLATKFIEKPQKKLTEKLIHTAGYFWNSGIYLFNIDYVLHIASKFIPAINEKIYKIFGNKDHSDIIKLDKEAYEDLPSVSFDKAISENLQKMVLVKANFKWNDLGNWESISNLNKESECQNNFQGGGKIIAYNVQDSYINSDAKKTIVIDLKGIIVVLKNGQLLIADKNSAELVHKLIAEHS